MMPTGRLHWDQLFFCFLFFVLCGFKSRKFKALKDVGLIWIEKMFVCGYGLLEITSAVCVFLSYILLVDAAIP